MSFKINENILICGIVKNCGNKIGLNLNLSMKTGKIFNDYKIIIYENNSTDNTKEELNKFTGNGFENILIISEDIEIPDKKSSQIWSYTEVTGSDHPCRIELISNARNKVLMEINSEKYDKFTYVIWIDMDSNGWDINGILDSFYKKKLWDVIYTNNHKNYYDMYAYRSHNFIFGPEIIGEQFWNTLPNFSINKENNLIPVYSAFGGLGIYKKILFKHYKFDFIVNDTIKEVYRKIIYHNRNKLQPQLLNIIQNPDKKFIYGFKDEKFDIFWKSNSGYNKPVVCEHVAFNFSLINDGFKVFINPKMIFYNT
jgi:hypothetical protein